MPKKTSLTERLNDAKQILIEAYVETVSHDDKDPLLDDLREAITATTDAMLGTLAPDAAARRALKAAERPHRHSLATQAKNDRPTSPTPPATKP